MLQCGMSSNPEAQTPLADDVAERAPTFSPLYQQIKGLIMRSLQTGEWAPGALIPSEQDLADKYKVSQGTVRKAIDDLAASHLLIRRQGKGTFVATHHEARVQYRFLRLQPDVPTVEPMSREVLDCRRVRATAEAARLLDIKTGDAVVQVRRMLRARGKPVVLDDIVLPGGPFRGLTLERLRAHSGPMYALFETEFGTRMIRAEERIRAVNADAATAGLLEVAVGTALLSVERVSFTYGDKPVELRSGLYVTSDHYYRNELA